MTELQWFYEGTTTRIIGLADDFFRRQDAIFRKRKDIPAYDVNQRRREGSDEPGINESALISFPGEEGARQAYMRAVAQGSGCLVTIEGIKDGWEFIRPYWLEFVKDLQRQNQNFVPTTISYRDIDEQLASELAQSAYDHQQLTKRFAIDTTPYYFGTWLQETTKKDLWNIKFPTSRGEFLLSPAAAEPKSDVHSPATRISLRGHEYLQSEDHAVVANGGLWGLEAIRFTLVPISDNRTEVTVQCLAPLVVAYYQELLNKIVEMYPETAKFLSSPETNQRQSTTTSMQQTINIYGDNVAGDKIGGNKIDSESISSGEDRQK